MESNNRRQKPQLGQYIGKFKIKAPGAPGAENTFFRSRDGGCPLGLHLFVRGRLPLRLVLGTYTYVCKWQQWHHLSATLIYASAHYGWNSTIETTGRAYRDTSKTRAKEHCVSATVIRRRLSKQALKGSIFPLQTSGTVPTAFTVLSIYSWTNSFWFFKWSCYIKC